MALDCDLSEDYFYNHSIAENLRLIESYNRRVKNRMRILATVAYTQAQLITTGVGIVLGSKETFPSISTSFPQLFDDSKEEEVIDTKSIANFMNFAKNFNTTNHSEE